MNEKKSPKILGIVGSPRKNGNTEVLVKEILEGAKDEGAEIDIIYLNKLKINPCQACEKCIRTGICQFDDDMNMINEKLNLSSVFIFGTPIYYWGPTGLFKTFFDRLLATSKLGYIKNKQAILAIPLGGSQPIARHTIGMLTDALNYLRADIYSTIVSPSTGEIGDMQTKVEIMKKARETGREITKKILNEK